MPVNTGNGDARHSPSEPQVECLVSTLQLFGDMGSFDSSNTSLREMLAALRMTMSL